MRLPMHKVNNTCSTSYAFFDVDETLISIKSMLSFMDFYFSHYPNKALERRFSNGIKGVIQSNGDRKAINTKFYSYFRDLSVPKVITACQAWFKNQALTSTFYNRNVIQRLKQHQNDGIQCVFVSGSFKELLQPIAEDLNIEHILCVNLEKNSSTYTGNIIPPQTIGNGKADAINLFLLDKNADPTKCFAYGDDISDVGMLSLVGFPYAIKGESELEVYAHQLGWKVINPN